MATKLNLASKPFSNRSLPWAVTALVVFVSLVSLIFILRATSRANARAVAIQNEINTLNQQEQGLRKQAEAVKNSLSLEQQQTLAATHTLVDRKRFSWSRLFSDLESALPGNVKATSISVRGVATRGSETFADLELKVVAKTPATVTQMIADMDREGIFHAVLRAQNLQRGRGESITEYELDVVYRPRAGAPIEPVAATPAERHDNDIAKGGSR